MIRGGSVRKSFFCCVDQFPGTKWLLENPVCSHLVSDRKMLDPCACYCNDLNVPVSFSDFIDNLVTISDGHSDVRYDQVWTFPDVAVNPFLAVSCLHDLVSGSLKRLFIHASDAGMIIDNEDFCIYSFHFSNHHRPI